LGNTLASKAKRLAKIREEVALMNISRIVKYTLALTLIAGAALLFSKLYLAYESDTDKEVNSLPNNIKSFEFLGCSGSWSDENPSPQVWRIGRKDKTIYLLKHREICGLTIGKNPRAKIDGATIDFNYDLYNENDAVSPCVCEYWAMFELKSNPENVKKILFNWQEAKMMSGLSEYNQNK
jgi:hypothetical protein